MNKKQIRMLKLLDDQIQKCHGCNLYKNGRVKPYWTEDSKYMMILESPSKDETEQNTLLVGKIGKIFWEIMSELQFVKRDFLIINSVNCRVMNGNKNGKPAYSHLECCESWIRKYYKVFQPKKVVLFGNYAIKTFIDKWGISSFYKNDTIRFTDYEKYGNIVDIIVSYHPSAMIFNKKKEIIKSIKLLKD